MARKRGELLSDRKFLASVPRGNWTRCQDRACIGTTATTSPLTTTGNKAAGTRDWPVTVRPSGVST